ncbi:MAG: Hsp20 family protein [Victivallales bacterium]|nr:Hsp20 family protein [Victivallales bacterium]
MALLPHSPVEINETKIKASFKKGVLTVNLPKANAKKNKAVNVKVEQG